MEQIKVQYLPTVKESFQQLALILYKKEYFSFLSTSIEYVEKMIDYIEEYINHLPHKTTPINLRHLGSYYVFYKANNRTTWYFFFENQGNRYLITHITNNHMKEANWL